MRVGVYRTYSDSGATAVDDRDGPVNVLVVSGLPVNTSRVTTAATINNIIYMARDQAGNVGYMTRTVEVYDDCVSPQFTCPPPK